MQRGRPDVKGFWSKGSRFRVADLGCKILRIRLRFQGLNGVGV